MRPRMPLLVGMSVVTCLMTARADVMPDEAYGNKEVVAATEIAGVSRFPDHVFYVFPAACTEAVARFTASLESDAQDVAIDPRFYYADEKPGELDYLVLGDGPLPRWAGGDTPCIASGLYALGREVAAGVALERMSLAELQAFFTEDRRVFRSTFEFQGSPLYAPQSSPLRAVHEVVRLVRLGPTELVAVLDAATYRFEDGTEQTLKLAHTKRPPLPFKPLRPDKLAKYAEKYAKWEARQPVEPAPAPAVPQLQDLGDADAPAEAPAATTSLAATDLPVATVAPAAVPLAVASTPAPAAAPPASVPAPVAPSAVPGLAAGEEDVQEDMDEETSTSPDPLWPLGAVLAGGLALVAVVALARRPHGA